MRFFWMIVKILMAVVIAGGIAFWVTGGDFSRISDAAKRSVDLSFAFKRERDAEKEAGKALDAAAALKSSRIAIGEAEESLAALNEALTLLKAEMTDAALSAPAEIEAREAEETPSGWRHSRLVALISGGQQSAEQPPVDAALTKAQEQAAAAVQQARAAQEVFAALSEQEQAEALKRAAGGGTRSVIPVSVVAMKSRAETLSDSLTMTGRTEAETRVQVRAQTGGLVESSLFRKGDRVQKGDLLCRISLGDRLARRQQLEAQLRQALIQEEAQRKLSAQGFAPRNQAETSIASAEAVRAQIRQLDVDISNTEIFAPIDGVIEEGPAEQGALLQAGGLCVTIVAPDPMTVIGFAPENAVGALALGDRATARLATGGEVSGIIRFIAQSADLQTRTFRVEIEVSNPNYRIRDGLTAKIIIPLENKSAHKLPQSALTLADDGRIGVRLADGDRARFVEVTILKDAADGVWVAGLPEEAAIIVTGQEYVSDGSLIRATFEADAPYGEPS